MLIMDRTIKEPTIAMIKNDSKLFKKRYMEIIKSMKDQGQEVVEDFKNMIEQISSTRPLISKTPKAVSKKVIFKISTIPEDDIAVESTAEDQTEDQVVPVLRPRRAASQKATENIKKQLAETLTTKLRRPSKKPTQTLRLQRVENSNNNLAKDMNKRLSKIIKKPIKRVRQIKDETLRKLSDSPLRLHFTSSRRSDIINETMEIDNDEQSIYEDAIDKILPMNSTMEIDPKMFNSIVVLEKINGTRLLSHKKSIKSINHLRKTIEQEKTIATPNKCSQVLSVIDNTLKRKLLTDIDDDDDDEVVPPTPFAELSKIRNKKLKESIKEEKYKAKALFSPYSKESVKINVETLERIVKFSVDDDDDPPITHVTRSMKAAEEVDGNLPSPIIKLAKRLSCKSIAKGKKISWRSRGENEDQENEPDSSREKERITPAKKSRSKMPMSVDKFYHQTPAKQVYVSMKPLTVSKICNMSLSTELRISKPNLKSSSTDSLNNKKQIVFDKDDARLRKEKAQKEQSDEKPRKREEKELKNQRTREAKARLEQEKFVQMEKKREEAEKKRKSQKIREREKRRKYEEQIKQQRLKKQKQLAEQKAKIHKQKKPNILDSNSDDDDKSDDESTPQWAYSIIRKLHMEIQKNIPNEIVLEFFGTNSWTPSLEDLFVDPKKCRLIRTSSANWERVPNISMNSSSNTSKST